MYRHFQVFCALLVGALCLCVSAETQPVPNQNADFKKRVEEVLRLRYHIAKKVQVAVGDRKPSEFGPYDLLPITLSDASHNSTIDFLISKDDKTLIQLNKIDLGHDPYDTAGRPSRGASSKNAAVTVIVYDDFQCPYCAQMHKTLFSEILPQYQDHVRVVYKDYPLMGIHPWAVHAAVDANCLFEQSNDAYWAYADYVHGNQAQIRGDERPMKEQLGALDQAAADQAKKFNVDLPRLQACTAAQNETAVRASANVGDDLGVEATPTLFINGEKLDGAIPADKLREVLDAALRDAGVAPPAAKAKPSAPDAKPGAAGDGKAASPK